MDLDLDINNYDLEDILGLFRIPMNFDERNLKNAKGIVLRTHPDKSGLPAEYFLFYSKAYKVLHSIWEFRQTSIKNTEYDKEEYLEKDKKVVLDKFLKGKDFNKWFNAEFEKSRIAEDDGYGEWLKAEEDVDKEDIHERKKKQRNAELIEYREIEELNASLPYGSELGNEPPKSFSSDLFSRLPYQDLKKAHTETVIGVTEEDFEKVQKFSNVEEYKTFRNTQSMTPLNDEQSRQYLKNKTNTDEERTVKRAYTLAKQSETAMKNNTEFWSNLFLIKY